MAGVDNWMTSNMDDYYGRYCSDCSYYDECLREGLGCLLEREKEDSEFYLWLKERQLLKKDC